MIEDEFYYLVKDKKKAEPEDAKLSIHSPNFKRFI